VQQQDAKRNEGRQKVTHFSAFANFCRLPSSPRPLQENCRNQSQRQDTLVGIGFVLPNYEGKKKGENHYDEDARSMV